MKDIRLIAAVGRRWQTGLDGRLPWHDRDDLIWFRRMTMDGILICGYRTLVRLPKLKGRTVMLDHDAASPERNIKSLRHYLDAPIWIIGGTKTWIRYAPLIESLYLSAIDYDGPADTFFPHSTFGTDLYAQAVWRNGLEQER